MKQTSFLLSTIFLMLIALTACRSSPPVPPQNVDTNQENPTASSPNTESPSIPSSTSSAENAVKIKAEVWADNWFSFYSGDQLIKEDSVSITTERSFNAETFTFDVVYPISLNFVVKDFKENDSGLEYIGTNKQQMGDGGLIAQFTNTDTGELIAVTDSNWVCMVIHEAPLDKACEKISSPVAGQAPCGFTSIEEPLGWKDLNFDDSSWSNANIYTEEQVSPKEGYDQISWDSSAEIIWGPDLETNNTLLCRLTVTESTP